MFIRDMFVDIYFTVPLCERLIDVLRKPKETKMVLYKLVYTLQFLKEVLRGKAVF